MSTPAIEAAREALAVAEAEVRRLQARLRAALADQAACGVSAEGRSTTADAPARHTAGIGPGTRLDAATGAVPS